MPYAFITPPTIPGSKRCRVLVYPDNYEISATIDGLLLELTYPHRWEQVDGVSVEDAVAMGEEIFRVGILELCAVPIGAVQFLARTDVPVGWLECDGSAVAKADYPELYAVLGGTFGEGVDNFNLPNIREKVLAGNNPYTGLDVGDTGGENERTLRVSEMPPHVHYYNGVAIVVQSGAGPLVSAVAGTSATSEEGGGAAFDNRQATLYLKPVIWTGRV